MSETRIHHPYSPSTLQAREACPCYAPTQRETDASIAGTIQHDAVEAKADDSRLSDLQAVAVAECIKSAEERLKAFPGGSHCQEVYLPIDDETVLAPDGTPFQGTTAGYVDYAIVSADETEAELLDWKFGKWAVTDAEHNLQGIAYMLGLKKIFPTLQYCTVRFIQPHIDFSSSHTFEIIDTTAHHLRIRTVVQRAIAAGREKNFASARPNTGSCLFCAHVGLCPKVADYALQVGTKFMPLALPKDISTAALSDPAQVAVGLKLAQVVQAWAESYRKQATAKAIEEEDFVPDGYQLVPSQKTVVRNAKEVGEAAKKFLPPEDAAKVEALYEISLTPLDKLISLRASRGVKEETVKEFRKLLLEAGHTEMGVPYAFLRQISVKDTP